MRRSVGRFLGEALKIDTPVERPVLVEDTEEWSCHPFVFGVGFLRPIDLARVTDAMRGPCDVVLRVDKVGI